MLDERKIKVALMWAQGIGSSRISEEVGCARQSVYNWLEEPDVAAEVDKHRQDFITQTIHMLSSEGPKTMNRLIYLRDHADSEKVQLDAGIKILDKLVSNATRIEIDNKSDDAKVTVDILEQELTESEDE